MDVEKLGKGLLVDNGDYVKENNDILDLRSLREKNRMIFNAQKTLLTAPSVSMNRVDRKRSTRRRGSR